MLPGREKVRYPLQMRRVQKWTRRELQQVRQGGKVQKHCKKGKEDERGMGKMRGEFLN